VHEYGLAADIVHGVQAEAERAGGKRLASLEVRVGALARLETETLSFWLAEEITEHIGAIDAGSVQVVRAPLLVTCLSCGHEASVATADDDLVMVDRRSCRCSECESDEVRLDGGADWEILAGWAEDGAPAEG
jgi:Zn finger protein HypA/HybF involved in hydrogenase expression